MFGFIKNKLIYQLTDLMQLIYTNLINLHPNEYSQELHYYQFAVKLDRYIGGRNILNDLPNKVWVLNKTED